MKKKRVVPSLRERKDAEKIGAANYFLRAKSNPYSLEKDTLPRSRGKKKRTPGTGNSAHTPDNTHVYLKIPPQLQDVFSAKNGSEKRGNEFNHG